MSRSSSSIRLLLVNLSCSAAVLGQVCLHPQWPCAAAPLPRAAALTALRHRPPRCCSEATQVREQAEAAAQAAAEAEAERIAAENREIRSLAIPALVNTLIDPILSLIDTIFVGRLPSTVSLGATTAASELFTLCLALSLSLRESASSTLARLTASGQPGPARDFALRTIQLGVALGTLISFLIAGPLAISAVSMMGAPVSSPLHADALSYARLRALALPAALGFSAVEGVFRGLGDTSVVLRAAAVAALVNAVLDPLMIFRPLGMGVGGAAAATAAAQWISFALLLRALRPRLAQLREKAAQPAEEKAAQPAELNVETRTDSAADSAKPGAPSTKTIGASLIRATSVLGTWVFITSSVSRRLGASAIAAHGVVLKVWLLFCLSCEAPAVAGQVLCARRLARGEAKQARQLLLRLLKLAFLQGIAAMLAVLAIARPAARFLISSDPTTAATALRLFSWAACSAPLVSPCVLLEQVLLGAGRSYRYLATSTAINAMIISTATHFALLRPGAGPSTAWAMIVGFFSLRLSSAAVRVRLSRGGFGRWGEGV